MPPLVNHFDYTLSMSAAYVTDMGQADRRTDRPMQYETNVITSFFEE